MSLHEKFGSPRRTGRTRVLMSGVLISPMGAHKVTIRDVSRSGAQVLLSEPIPKECDVLFRRGSLFAAARVAWVSNGEAGLRFYRELSPDEVEGTFPPAVMRKTP